MANITLRSTSNLLNILPKRYASAATASQAKEHKKQAPLAKEPIKVTKLDNGIVVASLENHSPVSRIAAVLNVGARDETHEQLGATHALRVYSSLATRNHSLFGLSRNLDQVGAQLSVTSSRETLTYLLENDRRNTQRSVDILGEIISRPQLRHWEISDAEPRLEFDLDVYDESPHLRINDLIHRASFKSGLSNSLFAPRYNIHDLNSELLEEFRQQNFTSNRLVLVGVGLPHDELLRYTDLFRLQASKTNLTRKPTKFIKSEIREDNDSDIVHVAIAGEGVSLSGKELLASHIASHAFGASGSRIKYSTGSNKLARAILSSAKDPFAVSSFNANYSDTGLFGFHIIGNKNDIGKLTKGVVSEVAKTTKNGLSNDDVNRAKNSLKAALSYDFETANKLVDVIASNPEQSNTHSNLGEVFKAIDAVSGNDVNAFVKRIGTGKHSLAAIGNLSELPRLEELNE
jgi:ubiquinol-cytochrome c reductase core subunit 2